MGSQATRDADAVLYTRAGLEVSVAATKTFVAQVAAMYLIGLRLAELRGTLRAGADRRAGRRAQAPALEDRGDAGRAARSGSREVAADPPRPEFFLYLGRHIGLPVCLEGALKLKEISYIPTDAYAAGEMKHGPIALLDESTPVVCVATESPVLDKVLSNVEEVRARGAETIAIATEGAERVAEVAEQTIEVARTDWILQPIVADPAAAAARLRHRPRARPQRRPAPQPGQDGHRRVAAAAGSLGCARMIKTRLVLPVLAAAAPRSRSSPAAAAAATARAATRPASRRPNRRLFVEATMRPTGTLKANVDELAEKVAGVERPRRD